MYKEAYAAWVDHENALKRELNTHKKCGYLCSILIIYRLANCY